MTIDIFSGCRYKGSGPTCIDNMSLIRTAAKKKIPLTGRVLFTCNMESATPNLQNSYADVVFGPCGNQLGLFQQDCFRYCRIVFDRYVVWIIRIGVSGFQEIIARHGKRLIVVLRF